MSCREPISRLTVLLLLLTALSPIAPSDTFIAFGPEDFVRKPGPPVDVERRFTVQNPKSRTYTLHIDNGGSRGQFARVSSAVITLNGVKVVKPNDFNQTVAVIEKPITLRSNNEL